MPTEPLEIVTVPQVWEPLVVRVDHLTYIQTNPGAATVNVYLTDFDADWPSTAHGASVTCFMFAEVPATRSEVVEHIVDWHREFTTPGGGFDDYLREGGF